MLFPGPPLLDAVVAVIGDEDRAVLGHRDGDRLVEVPAFATAFTKGGEKCPIPGKHLDTVIVEVGGEDVPVAVNGYAGRNRTPAVEGAEDVDRER